MAFRTFGNGSGRPSALLEGANVSYTQPLFGKLVVELKTDR
jgi:hypothetical protein